MLLLNRIPAGNSELAKQKASSTSPASLSQHRQIAIVVALVSFLVTSMDVKVAHAQDQRGLVTHAEPLHQQYTPTQTVRGSHTQQDRLFTPAAPAGMKAITRNGTTRWQATDSLSAERMPLRSTYDCTIDFNDEDALNLFSDKVETTFAFAPFWNQICNVDVSVNLRPFHINHFHLNYEGNACIDVASGQYGDMQMDGTCIAFDDPAKEPRYLGSMLPADVLELTAYNNYHDTRISFDLKRIRVVGNRPVRVCYKPAEQETGDLWVANEVDPSNSVGTWLCWNNLTTGYWDLSDWAGDVSAVRLIAADGQPNFAVDDILINAPPY